MQTYRLFAIAASFTLMAFSAHANDTTLMPIQDRPALELIGEIEGPDGYDDITLSASIQPPKPITQMTIGEVLAFQDRIVAAGSNSSAIGRYQFIRKTLKAMVKDLGIDQDVLFDRRTQDYLARRKLHRCGFYERNLSDTRVANCLARTWAALPVVSGPRRGRSHYDGQSGNSAKTTVSEVMKVVSVRFKPSSRKAATALR